MKESTKKIWDKAELIAIEYLQRKGYKILDTNFKFGRFWEIDIIASYGAHTIFFEVKYRSSEKYGVAEESITKSKLYKIYKSAQVYCKHHHIDYDQMKIEAIVIERHIDKHRLKHYRNIEV